ncbi:MAG: yurJ2 [Tardiphaga sp.]|jgi:multiple sugar transport system ATP-binding protein|nr:yurJ2 [Tardiphaga sp.]
MAQIEISHLCKSFKDDAVLKDLSLSVDKGEIVAVFGPSGTGKTVLLRLLAGIYPPDAGTISLRGRDATDSPPEKRGIGMAFQNFALFPHMTARDNIASALTARKIDSGEITRRVDAVAALLKIGHVLGHWPRELSNGQKQRTALARALVADPDILLLDDPLRNVDAKLRYEMRLELPALLKRAGSTVLYVTQDFKEAMALGDRIAVVLNGQIAQCDTPTRIYAEPASVGVARLFGDPTLNLVDVEPRLVDGAPEVLVGGAPIRLPASYAAAAGGSYILGLRPESLHLTEAHAPGTIAIDLVAVTPLNDKSVLLLTTEAGDELLASEAGDRDLPRRVGPGRVALDLDSVLLFDRESGRRFVPINGTGARP